MLYTAEQLAGAERYDLANRTLQRISRDLSYTMRPLTDEERQSHTECAQELQAAEKALTILMGHSQGEVQTILAYLHATRTSWMDLYGRMRDLISGSDTEGDHSRADELLVQACLKLLADHSAPDMASDLVRGVVASYHQVGKWYA